MQDENDIIDRLNSGETLQDINEENKKNKKEKRKPFIYLLLVGLISLSCGFFGAFAAIKLNPQGSVIYQTIQSSNQTTKLSSTETMTIQEIAAKAQTSVVEIKVEEENTQYSFFQTNGYTEASGSGVILTSDGYIVTNNHVVENASSIIVTLSNGKVYDAKLIGTDSKTDIAVIKIEETNLTPATLGDSNQIVVGETAVAIGNPLGTLGGSVTDGIISALDREITIDSETMNLLQTNAAINPGNSGGGLFDGSGNLIGIVVAKSSGSNVEGLGFAIPVNDVKEIVEQLITNGYVSNRATLGVYLTSLPYEYNGYEAGVYIQEVIGNSAAEKAGLKAYDKIIKFNGIEINSYDTLSYQLKKLNVGDVVEIVVEREDSEVTLNVTLQEAINPNN